MVPEPLFVLILLEAGMRFLCFCNPIITFDGKAVEDAPQGDCRTEMWRHFAATRGLARKPVRVCTIVPVGFSLLCSLGHYVVRVFAREFFIITRILKTPCTNKTNKLL